MSKRVLWFVCACVVGWSAPGAADAGWVVEWKNTAVKKEGRGEPNKSTAYISGDKQRIDQDHVSTIYDYRKGTFTLLNPARKFFWSGTMKDYVAKSYARRGKAIQQRMGTKTGSTEVPVIDKKSLPELKIERMKEEKEIAGHTAHKYEVLVDGKVFQELWVAEGLDLTKDLDPERMTKYQQERARGFLGHAADYHNALYLSDAYLKLLRKGYTLQKNTYHIAGSFEQLATSIRETDVDSSRFETPEDYRRVRLSDIFKTD